MKGIAKVLTVNAGSSSIKFALFARGRSLHRLLEGGIEGIGQPEGKFFLKKSDDPDALSRRATVPDQTAAVNELMDWIAERIPGGELAAVGHRIVHGGPKYWQPQAVTPQVIAELRALSPFDPEHLPQEISLIEAFTQRFPGLPQIGCFDTAFHHEMPIVAALLPIPRRYHSRGVRRYGFHGLSCEYLIAELGRVDGFEAAMGRVIIAHLGNGASLTAVHGGKSMDTSMSFTPTAGIPMSTRSGDLDPSLAWYLSCVENVSAEQFHHMVNHESGLLGISEISSDMRELFSREDKDARAAQAIAVFCYQAKKSVGALSAALGGLDTLIFAGGIGENDSEVRERICAGLGFLGIDLNPQTNASSAAVISSPKSKVTVRVIHTDEESIIAETVCRVVDSMVQRQTSSKHENKTN